ncbi:unnamed protein product [Urochloa humidicola]
MESDGDTSPPPGAACLRRGPPGVALAADLGGGPRVPLLRRDAPLLRGRRLHAVPPRRARARQPLPGARRPSLPRAAHPRLLAAPLADAVAGAAARRDAALASQASDLAAAVGAPAASELVARLARVLSSGSLVKHLHTVRVRPPATHIFGLD